MTRPSNPLNVPGYQPRRTQRPVNNFCPDCYQRVLVVRMTLAGRQVNVDPDPATSGIVCVNPTSVATGHLSGFVIGRDGPARPGWPRYRIHWATCTGR